MNQIISAGKTFAEILKTSFFGLSEPSKHIWTLFLKTGIRHFYYFMMSNFMGKVRKNSWSRGLTLQRDGKTSKAKFFRTLQLGWLSNSFPNHVDVMDFQLQNGGKILWDFWWNYMYHKVWYKQRLHLVEKHQLGTNATKMKTK